MPIFPNNTSRKGVRLPAKLAALAAGFNVFLHCGEPDSMSEPVLIGYDTEKQCYLAFVNTKFPEEIYLPAFCERLNDYIKRFPSRLLSALTDVKPERLKPLYHHDLTFQTVPKLCYWPN